MEQLKQVIKKSGVGGLRKPAILGGTPVFDEPLAFNEPTLPPFQSISKEIETVLTGKQLTNGSNVAGFEDMASAYFNRPAVALASCTSALILTAKLLGLTGQVIVPSFTFFATAHALIWNGLEPLFVDIKPDSWNLDPEAVEAAINPKVSAILSVDVFGNPCDKEALGKIARQAGLKWITDAAHALGGAYQGRPIGSFGDAEIFSLSPTKVVVAGEGGLVGVKEPALAKELKSARDYGNTGDYSCQYVGLNARMTEINAVIGKACMDMMAANVARRNKIADLYKQKLKGLPGLCWQKIEPGNLSTYKDIAVLVEPEEFGMNRDELARALAAEGILTRKYFSPPAHKQPAYDGLGVIADELAVTERISENILCMPIFSHMEASVVDKICGAITRIYQSAAGPDNKALQSS